MKVYRSLSELGTTIPEYGDKLVFSYAGSDHPYLMMRDFCRRESTTQRSIFSLLPLGAFSSTSLQSYYTETQFDMGSVFWLGIPSRVSDPERRTAQLIRAIFWYCERGLWPSRDEVKACQYGKTPLEIAAARHLQILGAK